jgi:hypothetical protein
MAREKGEVIADDNEELKLGSQGDKLLKSRLIRGLSTWSYGRLIRTMIFCIVLIRQNQRDGSPELKDALKH